MSTLGWDKTKIKGDLKETPSRKRKGSLVSPKTPRKRIKAQPRNMAKKTYKRKRRSYSRKGISKKRFIDLYDQLSSGRQFGEKTDNWLRYGPSDKQIAAMTVSGKTVSRTAEQMQNRIRDSYYGPGDYVTNMERGALAGAGVGGIIGSGFGAVGAAPGAAIGAGVGALAGAADEYFGKGDYLSVRNQIAGGGEVVSVNKMDRTGDIFIQQTEFIGNLTASVTNSGGATATLISPFSIESYDINPGMDKMFPFLSQIASNYELYDWNGLMVCYKPNSGETSTASNQLGKVIVATNYDPDATDFRTSIEMQNYDYSNSCKPSQKLVHGIETARHSGVTNMLYVRDTVSSKDRVLTDIGKLFIATEGVPIECPAGTTTHVVLGELHVTYAIRLSRAKLYQALLGYSIASDRFTLDRPSAYTIPTFWLRDMVPHPSNAGKWNIANGPLTTQATIRSNAQMVAGCFKWTLYIRFDQLSGSSLAINNVTPGAGVKLIAQTNNTGPTTANYLQTQVPLATPPGPNSRFFATGYISVNNVNDIVPEFTLTFNRNTGTTDANIYVKFSITQVSCRLEDNLY